eukprot:CAMPEP_0172788144 /NCGR_PEP_ID=MMETSP1074-20121228/206805_1 /TAXON_ID=2916 /ORGANISM="Ceratium fusus, Strain PA161109" /LENGTH=74 /DNA_ID=CAMNT_0013625167 /DNA_START=187 /DNA_END=411 /DNA_ORIENTATION=+
MSEYAVLMRRQCAWFRLVVLQKQRSAPHVTRAIILVGALRPAHRVQNAFQDAKPQACLKGPVCEACAHQCLTNK